jgi:glutaminyl-tRNA synthetase
MPTLRGIRRRGFPPEALRNLLDQVGLARSPMTVEMEMLEYFVREHLNKHSPRVMAVLDPIKVVITNYPEGQTETMEAVNNPEDPDAGVRQVPFSRELYIEREDFQENPHKKFYRLSPGREVRLRYAYFITCEEVVKDDNGEIVELRCTYDPATKGGDAPDGRKVKATLHWVSADHALNAEVRLYDHLFDRVDPDHDEDGKDFIDYLNPNSLEVRPNCKVEPYLADAQAGERYQFERVGYFCVDQDRSEDQLVFNRTVTLRDQWARVQKQQNG